MQGFHSLAPIYLFSAHFLLHFPQPLPPLSVAKHTYTFTLVPPASSWFPELAISLYFWSYCSLLHTHKTPRFYKEYSWRNQTKEAWVQNWTIEASIKAEFRSVAPEYLLLRPARRKGLIWGGTGAQQWWNWFVTVLMNASFPLTQPRASSYFYSWRIEENTYSRFLV